MTDPEIQTPDNKQQSSILKETYDFTDNPQMDMLPSIGSPQTTDVNPQTASGNQSAQQSSSGNEADK